VPFRRGLLDYSPLLLMTLLGCGPDHASELDLGMQDLALPPALACTSDQVGDAGVPGTWQNVEVIIESRCSNGMCHYPGYIVGGLDLTHGNAYVHLVNQTPQDPGNVCGGVIVKPFHPEQSYLLVKLSTPVDPQVCEAVDPKASGLPPSTMQCNPKGSVMPVGEPFSCPLDNCKIDIFRRWILAGAPAADGSLPDASVTDGDIHD
jgi:hypothetical protein